MTRNRRADWRRVKSHLNYTVDDAARLLHVHRGTVRHWIKKCGLPVLSQRRPHLILGKELVSFLKAQRVARKRKCAPGELYCLKCRASRRPVPGMLEYRRIGGRRGVLVGVCEHCETLLRRFVAEDRSAGVLQFFGVSLPLQHESLGDDGIPPLNPHFKNREPA